MEAEVEEAVHGEDGRRRVREEASDSGKEGRSRERKWCDGGRRWRKAAAAATPAHARHRRRPIRVEGERERRGERLREEGERILLKVATIYTTGIYRGGW